MWESASRLAKIWPSSIKITGRRKSPRVQRTNSARSAMENAWPTIATSKWLDRQSRKTSSRQMAAATSKPAERSAAFLALPDRLIRWEEYLLMLSYRPFLGCASLGERSLVVDSCGSSHTQGHPTGERQNN